MTFDMESREQGASAMAAAFRIGWDDGAAGKPEAYGKEIARRIGARCVRQMQPTCLRYAYRAGYTTAAMQIREDGPKCERCGALERQGPWHLRVKVCSCSCHAAEDTKEEATDGDRS